MGNIGFQNKSISELGFRLYLTVETRLNDDDDECFCFGGQQS